MAESDGRLLDGVSIRFEGALGTFEVPTELCEAHQLRIREDDLVCRVWNDLRRGLRGLRRAVETRGQLIQGAFQALGGRQLLGCLELRKLAKFTGD